MYQNADGTLRWKNMCFLVQGVAIVGVHYLVIIYFGLKMHFNMKLKLKDYSATYQRLQNQFFRALVVQTLAPTVMFVIPAGCILLGPLFSPIFGIHMSLQTGWLCSVFSLYPPIDSIAFMMIVTEYKKVIKEHIDFLFTPPETLGTVSETTDTRAKPIRN